MIRWRVAQLGLIVLTIATLAVPMWAAPDLFREAAAHPHPPGEPQKKGSKYTTAAVGSEDWWAALRACESSGNYQAVSPSGKYRGAYQFSRSTWDWVAARYAPGLVGVDPASVHPWGQDVMAWILLNKIPGGGPGHWPNCPRRP